MGKINKHKGFLFGVPKYIFLAIIILIGVGILYLNQGNKATKQSVYQSDEPSGWETYVRQSHFSLSYPSGWNLSEHDCEGTKQCRYAISLYSPVMTNQNNTPFHIAVLFEKTNLSEEEWLKSSTVNKGGYCCEGEFTLKETSFNGRKFYRVNAEEGKYPGVITKSGQYVYYIYANSGEGAGAAYYYDSTDEKLMKNLTDFEEIISTFKTSN